MSEYTRWQRLNETLGFPLGVKSLSNLGITGLGLEEAKSKKKKMDGMVPPPEEDDDDDDDGEEIEIGKDDDDGGLDIDIKKDKKPCKCAGPDMDDDDDGPGGPGPMFCKNCKGMKSGNKKCMKKGKKGKKNMKEDIFAPYRGETFKEFPNVGTEEHRASFFKSLEDHFTDPDKRNGGGVDLGEEVIFEPRDEVAPLSQMPAGQPGSSPYTRLGEDAPAKEPQRAAWEKQFNKVPSSEEFIKDAGLNASFDEWLKKQS